MEKENVITKITIGEVSYCIFFCLLLFAKAIGLYDGQGIFKVLLLIACVFWLVKMCLTEYTVRELCFITSICMLAGVTYLCSGEKGALLYTFMVVGLKNVDVKKVFACGCVVWIMGFVSLVILNVTHVMNGSFKVHIRPLVGHVVRWALGYAHPNVAHVSYLVLVLFVVYLLDKHFSWKACILLMIGNAYVLLYTGSQTGFIAVSFYLLMNVYLMYRRNLGKVEQLLIQCIFPVAVMISLIAPMVLESETPAFEILNKVTNTRLRLSQYFLEEQPVKLFGARMENLVTPYKTMDNSYVFAYLTYGIILFAVICIGYVLLINVFCREKKWKELAIIISIVIAGITEPFLFNTSFKNLSLLFMCDLLFRPSEYKKKQIHLLSRYNLAFSLPDLTGISLGIRRNYEEHKKKVCVCALLIAVCAGIIYAVNAEQPNCILAPRSECDLADTEDIYLEESEVLEMDGMLVLGYVDDKTAMWSFEGNTVRAEYVRGIVSSALLSGVFGGIIILIVCGLSDRKRNF